MLGRRSTRLLVVAVALSTGATGPARAEPPPGATGRYEQHMASGKKLLEDESWLAAQAEFEAAYAAQPRAAPLVQIAVCAEAVQRWAQAIAALERALRDHAATLDEVEKKAAEQALAELRAQLGTLVVSIAPPDATLRIDGEDQPGTGPRRSIVVGPGQHRVEARLEGWAPAARTIALGSGGGATLELALAPDRGRVTVHAPDGANLIAVDESRVGTGEWSGWLPPGPHVVHVYAPQGAAWSMAIEVVAGAAVEVSPAQQGSRSAAPEGPRRPVRGPYGLLALTAFVPLPPTDFVGTAAGFSGGVRLGYPLTPIVGGELVVEYAHAAATGEGKPAFADTPGGVVPLSYALSSLRAGLGVRLTTTGERARFVQVFSGGVMYDAVRWTPGSPGITRQGASGVDGFGMSETGVELDFSGGLLGLTLQQVIGSRGALELARHDAFAADTFPGPQYALGLGVRGGYRLW